MAYDCHHPKETGDVGSLWPDASARSTPPLWSLFCTDHAALAEVASPQLEAFSWLEYSPQQHVHALMRSMMWAARNTTYALKVFFSPSIKSSSTTR
mmetsp:Transcript_74028/g.217221  ORF Transcript_74028/g.217221 Transcript_74028/m.217221 type:complete len:96 (+) Transcript_74028:154-441(+)